MEEGECFNASLRLAQKKKTECQQNVLGEQ